ncbi:MAG TPA: mechanosensitive ion channel family protein [Myxococcota bacterium]|nr:mechanosensitive ion channel family protein [Myxococcota bacterium]
MPTDRLDQLYATLTAYAVPFGLKVLGALALWIVGRRLIHLVVSLMQRGLRRQPIDPTVIGFIGSAVAVTLNIVLVVALLGFFGIETTSFAALLAGAGLAVGTAWSGLLANFAAGIFLMILHPFKAGDFVTAGGVTGTVEEIGLFATILNTPDNIRTFVGNNKILSDTIQNFSTNAYRRVDLVAQLAASVDPQAAIRILRERIAKIPHVLPDPAPVLEIVEFTSFGPKLAVRPFCNNEHYWQVYFDGNRVIRESFGEAGFPAPEQLVAIRQTA